MLYNAYLKKPVLDKETEKLASEQGLEDPSHKAIVDTTKKAVQDYNESLLRREKIMEDMR